MAGVRQTVYQGSVQKRLNAQRFRTAIVVSCVLASAHVACRQVLGLEDPISDPNVSDAGKVEAGSADANTANDAAASTCDPPCSGTTPYCASGRCVGARCAGLPATCGALSTQDCCAASVIPGGTFARSYDGVTFTDSSQTASVHEFRLDTFAVTVGRFRAFIAGYPATLPANGAGKNPNVANDPGWNSSWSSLMPATGLGATLAAQESTWTEMPADHETWPITAATWYEAMAFCIWDGGRLPTEAEWNYAAAGGSEQRVYPWSSPATSTVIDETYAVYCQSGGCPPNQPQRVGSRSPKGDGKWGQADLAGNVWEFTVDYFSENYTTPCNDCANFTSSSYRVYRGGSSNRDASFLLASFRGTFEPAARGNGTGFRCARDAP